MKLCGVVAIIASSPLLALPDLGFIVPGLHPKREAVPDVRAVAGPLFFLGVATGYYTIPRP